MHVTYETIPGMSGFRHLMRHRDGVHPAFVDLVLAEPRRTRVLEIGAGPELNANLVRFAGQFGQLDGIDPDPAVVGNQSLAERFVGGLETTPVPQQAYDLAYAFNVVEHVHA